MPAPFVHLAAFVCCLVGFITPLEAQPNSLSVTLKLGDLPATITLCRDATAIQAFGTDEQWQVAVDVVADAATPGGSSGGAEVMLFVETLPQSAGCSASTAFTSSSIVGGLASWDPAAQSYAPTDIPVNVSFDFTAKTLTLTAPLVGALANLKGAASVEAAAFGTYTQTASSPTYTYDNAAAFTAQSSTTDPVGDVQQCSSPCGSSASWYSLVDLLGASATTTIPVPMYGADTVYFEFDTAGLPSTMSLCRYPQASTFVDSQWLAILDIDNNPTTGSGGFDTIVEAHTIPQASTCTPDSLPLAQSLQADINHWDDTQQIFVPDATVPVSADATTGKLFIQVDRHAAALSGLSSLTNMGMQGAGAYPNGTYPFAYDGVGPLPYGTPVSATSGDVQNCTSPCSPAASWYPQIDLVGGYVHLAEHLFTGDFE